MKVFPLSTLAVLALAACHSLPTPPDWAVYGSETRILVVSSPSANHPSLKQQKAALEGRLRQWEDLRLTAVALLAGSQQPLLPNAPGAGPVSVAVREDLKMEPSRFMVVLLGANGEELIRSAEPLSTSALTDLLTRPRRPAAPEPPVIRDWAHDR